QPSWQSLATALENAGFSVQLPFTGTPDANGNLFEVTWSQTSNLSALPLAVTGTTGFSYLDAGGGGLFGVISGSRQVAVAISLGVDLNAQNTFVFFIAPSPNIIQANISGSTGSDSLMGSLAIGDLANVNVTASASITVTGKLGMQATAMDGKIRAAD